MIIPEYGRVLAERGGFEPPVELLTLRRFSKPLLSTTQPPLREVSEHFRKHGNTQARSGRNGLSWGAQTPHKRKCHQLGVSTYMPVIHRAMYMGESDSNGIATVKTCVIGY